MKENHYDVCVIGAGIVGLAHAYHAARKGYKVIVFERNQFALSASIRNFGLVWPIGQATETVDRAMRGRATWLELAQAGVLHARQNGSLHLAYYDDEMDVLEEFQSGITGETYKTSILSPAQIADKYPHINQTNLKGGLLSETELTVDPREVIGAIPGYLEEKFGVAFRFGKTVLSLGMNKVSTWDESIEADQIIICSGADFETLYPSLYQRSGMKKCKLQMMRTQPMPDFELGPTLCAGLTLRHYDAFSHCSSLAALSDRYDQTHPEMRQFGIHVLISQNSKGELIIGDSHAYDSDFAPFDQEEINQHILDYLSTFFQVEGMEIKERWHGIYPKLDGKTEWVISPENGVHIVNGLSGAGMTLSFGLAEEHINQWMG